MLSVITARQGEYTRNVLPKVSPKEEPRLRGVFEFLKRDFDWPVVPMQQAGLTHPANRPLKPWHGDFKRNFNYFPSY
jgi:hypothetical protein